MLFYESYYAGNLINYNKQDKNEKISDSFHFEIVEATYPCFLSAGKRQITLNQNDIVVSEYFKNVVVRSKEENHPCLRHFGIDIKYPTPLNQYLVADNPLIHDFMNDKGGDLRYLVFTNLNDMICHAYLNLLQIFSRQKSDAYLDFETQKVTGLLFTELLHNHRSKISKNQSDFPSNKVKYGNKYTQAGPIMTYISSKNGNVTLGEVADHFGYQKNYLSRLCHKLFKHDFIHLRLIIRINLACEQLKLTTKSIDEISSELGYRDVSTFTKQFLEVEGMTPSTYRKQNAIFL